MDYGRTDEIWKSKSDIESVDRWITQYYFSIY